MRPMSTTAAALLDLVLHEMRTPITVATGSLRQVGPLGEATAQAAIDRAIRSCARLDQLASQMRDWVRTIETPPATEVQAVDDLVRTAVTRAKANRTPDPAVQIDQGPPVKAAGAPALAGRGTPSLSRDRRLVVTSESSRYFRSQPSEPRRSSAISRRSDGRRGTAPQFPETSFSDASAPVRMNACVAGMSSPCCCSSRS